MHNSVLRAVGVTKGFVSGGKRIEVLRGVDLDVKQPSTLSIRGESGCGKTTLLNILSMLEQPDGGEVWWGDGSVGGKKPRQVTRQRGRHFGMVFQSYYLIPEINALENVLIAARVTGGPADRDRAKGLMERVGLSERMRASPPTLSGGERQRVAVARALMNNPAVILADEPTGNLDERTAGSIMEMLLDVAREQATSLVLVTHNPVFAAMAQRQLTLHNGLLQ